MKKLTILALLIAVLSAPLALGQDAGGTQVAQQASHYDACAFAQTATGAGNTAVTVTIPAQAGKYFNICTVDLLETANAAVTGAAGPAPILTMAGAPNNLIYWGNNTTLVIGDTRDFPYSYMPNGYKSSLGTAMTFTLSAGQATQSVRVTVTGWYSLQ